ncbi:MULTISPECIES: hypothetical protein [Shewanella]|uniref:Primosomal replication protein N n=1 Tax=Shewanella oncorhynchi TaxID=2726434 RepID=A0ABX1KR29_9GAMM|nr:MULTISPECIES: hypothetical protein [Shewanella]MCU8032200.1 hypothetical protein [Shewanella sp. SM73]NLQ24650.1 hypothetical protein [Shewanella oncorhynchi]
MNPSQLTAKDEQLLQRLLAIRSDKEAKLRRELALHRQKLRELLDRQILINLERQAQTNRLRLQQMPEQILTPTELITFKLTLMKEYQKERTLAETAEMLVIEKEQLESIMVHMQQAILQLVKSQQKLQEVVDE